MTPEQRAALKAAAEAATPGPWIWCSKSGSLHQAPPDGSPYTYGDIILAATYSYDTGVDCDISEANAAYIAAANPAASPLAQETNDAE